MTEPTYWDNALYTIRGDLIDLKRHVNALLADVGFCAEHRAMHAIQHIENEATILTTNLKRKSLRATRRGLSLHPRTAVIVCCGVGALAGVALYQALHKAPPKPQPG